MRLTLAMLNQLAAYIDSAERDGWYYAPKDQFRKRHELLKQWLANEFKALTNKTRK